MSVEIEKQLSRKEIYDGHIIHVCVDQIDLAGKKKIREVVLHSGASAIVPVTQNGGIIFVKQYRYPVQQALLEIPAGKMDPGETPEDCASREMEEEIVYQGSLIKLGMVYTTPGFSNEAIHLYLARDLVKTHQHLDEGEYLDIIELPIETVREYVNKGLMQDAKTLSALAIASQYLK
jgi:ADP-ribose pyrophosphatase